MCTDREVRYRAAAAAFIFRGSCAEFSRQVISAPSFTTFGKDIMFC
jgi:hypothetical protein